MGRLIHSEMNQFVDLCAKAIDLPVDELVRTGFQESHLQARAAEEMHESEWQDRFHKLGAEGRRHLQVQMVENGSHLARPALTVIPAAACFRLEDSVVRTLLRRFLLLPPYASSHDSRDPVAGDREALFCRACNAELTPVHPSCCPHLKDQRNRSHDQAVWALKSVLSRKVRDPEEVLPDCQGPHFEVHRESWEGDLRHDLLIFPDPQVRNRRITCDVRMAAVTEADTEAIVWPGDGAVREVAEHDKENAANRTQHRRPVDFFWEDHSGESASDEVWFGRAFRKCMANAALRKTLLENAQEKITHYQDRLGLCPVDGVRTQVVPFVLTVGGGVCSHASDFLAMSMKRAGSLRHQVRFRNFIRSRLSIILLHRLHYSIQRCSPRGPRFAP